MYFSAGLVVVFLLLNNIGYIDICLILTVFITLFLNRIKWLPICNVTGTNVMSMNIIYLVIDLSVHGN